MFGLGLWEAALLLLLLTFAFRKWIRRQWPQLGTWMLRCLWLMAAVVLVWDVLALLRMVVR